MFEGFAIDSPGTGVVDDAVWVGRHDGGWRVRVAFPRLASYVAKGERLDAYIVPTDARPRGGRVEAVLDRRSLERLSLDTVGTKDVFVVTFDVSEDGSKTPPRVARTAFRSLGCLDHGSAFEAYGDAEHPLNGPLRDMVDAAEALSVARTGRKSAGNKVTAALGEILLQANASLAESCAAADYPLVYLNIGHDGKRAVRLGYSPAPLGRCDALGLAAYATFTSPLRRYADLVNQRLLEDALDRAPPSYAVREIARLAARMNGWGDGADRAVEPQPDPRVKIARAFASALVDPEARGAVAARCRKDPGFAAEALAYGRDNLGWAASFEAAVFREGPVVIHRVAAVLRVDGQSVRTPPRMAGRLNAARAGATADAVVYALEAAAARHASTAAGLGRACREMGWDVPVLECVAEVGGFRCRAYVPGFELTLSHGAAAPSRVEAERLAWDGLAAKFAEALATLAAPAPEIEPEPEPEYEAPIALVA